MESILYRDNGVVHNISVIVMIHRAQQEEYLASIAQAVDAGDFDYLSPEKMHSLNTLIATAWQALKQDGDVESCISEIEQAIALK